LRNVLELSAKLVDDPAEKVMRLILVPSKIAVIIGPSQIAKSRTLTESFYVLYDE
jgi:hypothetical protein